MQANKPIQVQTPFSNLSPNEIKEFKALSYEIFVKLPMGARYIQLLQQEFFFTPTITPGRDPSFGFFREGSCEIVRLMMASAMAHMKDPKEDKPPVIKRERD